MMWVKWWIYLVGIAILLMGLLALVLPGFMGVYDPWWHGVLKIIAGAITIYAGMQIPD
jgi:uncharacterized membrane protein HdeD (DUF308 family)